MDPIGIILARLLIISLIVGVIMVFAYMHKNKCKWYLDKNIECFRTECGHTIRVEELFYDPPDNKSWVNGCFWCNKKINFDAAHKAMKELMK